MIKLICVSAAFVLLALCSRSNGELPPQDLVHAERFLKRYGYMHPDSKADPENMRESVKAMQQFAGLEPTGELNAETMKKMKSKRCSLPDMDSSGGRAKRFVVVRKWSFLDHTYSVINYPVNRSACLTNEKINEYLVKVFKIWAGVLTGFTVTAAPAGKNGSICISFGDFDHGDKFKFDGIGDILGHAFFPDSGKVHFDSSEWWGCFQEFVAGTKLPYTYFFEVALHEIGHIMGMGHSLVNTAVMAPYYHGDKEDIALTQDDIDGIRNLYGL